MEKIAIVTGVSREMGLGNEVAQQLVSLGFKVIVTARQKEKAESLSKDTDLIPMGLDITSDNSVERLAKEVAEKFGKLDVLINNAAGYFDQGAELLDSDIAYFKDALDTNLLGAFRMSKAFLPLLMKSEAGRIVNVSSGAGSFTDPVFGIPNHMANVPVYSITKLALNGLTGKLARQLKETSIKVNSVCPGFVATYPGTEQWGARPVADGAKGIVWAATLPQDGPTGGFFRDGKPLSW